MRELKAREFLWIFLGAISLALILGSFQYSFFDPSHIPRRNGTTRESFPLVFLHVICGGVWLLTGFSQFVFDPRKDRLKHRISGAIYVTACLGSTFSLIAITVQLGTRAPFGQTSFPMTIFTLISLLLGLIFIKMGDRQAHRAWMIRSMVFAIIMPLTRLNSAVSELLDFPLVSVTGLEFLVLAMSEIVVRRSLEFPVWRRAWGIRGYISLFLIMSITVVVFYLTAHLEYRFVNKLIF